MPRFGAENILKELEPRGNYRMTGQRNECCTLTKANCCN